MVKAVNLNFHYATLFKNKKIEKLSEIKEVLDTANDYQIENDQHPTVSSIHVLFFARYWGWNKSDGSKDSGKRTAWKASSFLLWRFHCEQTWLGTCMLGTKYHMHLKPGTSQTTVSPYSICIPERGEKRFEKYAKRWNDREIMFGMGKPFSFSTKVIRGPRICVDYRKLNETTMFASYPSPNSTETPDRLAGATFFTSIDIVNGYHQFKLPEEDGEKTAYGLFQYWRMPYGLAGAPTTFQSAVKDMVRVLETEDIMAYFDDVICFHGT